MRTLVAGGAGMIGRNIVNLLPGPCSIADIRTDGNDLKDFFWARSAMRGMDQVFDCAAKTVGIHYSQTHHGEMFHDTAQISMNLLEAARIQRVKRFMVTSSSCVYPDRPAYLMAPVTEAEGDLRNPENANKGYGWAKRMAELQARFYAEQYGMHIVIVRPGNVYGPSYNWENKDMHVIPSLISKMLAGDDPLIVWGSGDQTRAFLYEEDCARMMIGLMEQGESGEAYNLGGQETTIRELVTTLSEITGYKGKIVFDETKPEGPARKAQNAEKAYRLTGISPKVTLRDGLERTLSAAQRDHRTLQSANRA